MGKLLNMGIAMQVQNPPVVINYTPSPNSRAVEVTISRSVSFDKTFTVGWEGLDNSSNPISGSVNLTILANNTVATSGNQLVIGETFTRIFIQVPSADPGYNWTYTGDWTP